MSRFRMFWQGADLAGVRSSASPKLSRGDRLLASAPGPDGPFVATTQGFTFSLADGSQTVSWAALASATWDDDSRTLTITELAGGRHALVLEQPGLVPEVVRERLTANIVFSAHVPLVGESGVRILARRRAQSSELLWQLVYDDDVPQHDPAVKARAEAAMAEMRVQTGI